MIKLRYKMQPHFVKCVSESLTHYSFYQLHVVIDELSEAFRVQTLRQINDGRLQSKSGEKYLESDGDLNPNTK